VLSSIGRTFFDLQAYGGTKVQLSLDDIRELPVPLPPSEVQAGRIRRLESRLSQLNELDAHVAHHIDRLREYRSSLISAAVNGQLDIDAFWAKRPEAA
jgi:type I restriction enzyme S subunit